MRIILFGAGGYLKDRTDIVSNLPDTLIVGIVDSNTSVQGEMILGHVVMPPDNIDLSVDFIVISTSYAMEIESKLVSIGVSASKIMRLSEYESYSKRNDRTEFIAEDHDTDKNKSILAFTPTLEYNGACLALIYALIVLKNNHGYYATIVSPKYKDDMVNYILRNGINIIIRPNILFEDETSYECFAGYDYVIVNTLLMRRCLKNLSPAKTIWWLHEPDFFYAEENRLWGDFSEEYYNEFSTYCVSPKGKSFFQKWFPGVKVDVLEYGIPEMSIKKGTNPRNNERIVMAIVGFVNKIKGNDIMIRAMKRMPERYRQRYVAWFIGSVVDKSIIDEASELLDDNRLVVYGGITHEDIERLYKDIDMVVAPSREDTMSIAITEGLMNEKICVMSDATGISQYVKNKRDAFVFKSEDEEELANILCYLLDNYSEMNTISENGRKVYEDFFSMNKMGQRFLNAFEGLKV